MSENYMMPEKREQVKPNAALVASVDNHVDTAGDAHGTKIVDVDKGINDKLGASQDANLRVEVLAEADDSKHGTKGEEKPLNSHANTGFISGSARNENDNSTAANSPPLPFGRVGVDHIASDQAGDDCGLDDDPPLTLADRVFLAQVPADDFKIMNNGLFNYNPQLGFNHNTGHTIIVTIGNVDVWIHTSVLARSQALDEIFVLGSRESVLGRAVLPNVGLPEFKILMLAIYGTGTPILGHQAYTGVDYMKALSLSDTLRCDAAVYESVAQYARGHFSAFKNWMSIPYNSMTQALHRTKILEINEAYKAYKGHVRTDGPRAFMDNSFAILLSTFCPANVYCLYSDALDGGLVLQVSNASLLQRGCDTPFSAEETKLFTCPPH